ncbi:phosphatase PAP2 family protein [Legionella jordanis]|uniref:phosphatase PAP2 family protein n=1 Tax=Legionella jordanis TaxID=456 RepID=UPI000EFA7883|nr:phosphatase PAP2 family protein [Legionella jordanis]RMW99909.1 phosphatase PAP2 family protein [Legionella jordanis]
MEHLNLIWYTKINAGINLHGYSLWISIFFAKYLVLLIVLWLLGLWFWGMGKHRHTLLLAFCSCFIALTLSWIISLLWYHPRPFMMGVGHTYMIHAPDSSFPSDHMTALCAISFIFLWKEPGSFITISLIFMALVVGWARIYTGVHFPLDILGGIAVALLSSGIVMCLSSLIERHLFPAIQRIYRMLFAEIIRKQWVKN